MPSALNLFSGGVRRNLTISRKLRSPSHVIFPLRRSWEVFLMVDKLDFIHHIYSSKSKALGLNKFNYRRFIYFISKLRFPPGISITTVEFIPTCFPHCIAMHCFDTGVTSALQRPVNQPPFPYLCHMGSSSLFCQAFWICQAKTENYQNYQC